jgi:hypothetical protein
MQVVDLEGVGVPAIYMPAMLKPMQMIAGQVVVTVFRVGGFIRGSRKTRLRAPAMPQQSAPRTEHASLKT